MYAILKYKIGCKTKKNLLLRDIKTELTEECQKTL
jgi:hypothetical protein